jgi:hypothetical protein
MSLGSYLTRIFNEPTAFHHPDGWAYERKPDNRPGAPNPAAEKPKPKLAAIRQAPSKESFDAWRDHPVTQFVFAAHRQIAKECREDWDQRSWEAGIADQKALDELRVRADTYNALPEADYTAYCETLGLEPRLED